jgi:hypothetical protein
MKKALGLIIAAALLFCGLAGHAMAIIPADPNFTAPGQLIRVVYDTTYNPIGEPQAGTGSFEVITDLGNLSTLLPAVMGGTPKIVGGGADAFTNFAGYGTTIPFSSLQVTYYALNAPGQSAFVSGSAPLMSNDSAFTAFETVNGVNQQATHPTGVGGIQGSAHTVEWPQGIARSFNSWVENAPSGPGTYQGFINSPTGTAFLTESNLSPLDPFAGSVTQRLYGWGSDVPGFSGDINTGTAGIPLCFITTNANGSTTLYALPVPPAILLLGPGLVGLLGIRGRLW